MRSTRTRDERIIAAYLAGDLTFAEIGAEFDCSEQTVQRVVTRARKRGLRKRAPVGAASRLTQC